MGHGAQASMLVGLAGVSPAEFRQGRCLWSPQPRWPRHQKAAERRLFRPQCDHRIDSRCTACGNKARQCRNECEYSRYREINGWFERVNFKQNITQGSGGQDTEEQGRATGAENEPDDQLPRSLCHHHAENACGIRT